MCGGGTRTRTRHIRQTPLLGGRGCPNLIETRTCGTSPCLEDYELAEGKATVSSSVFNESEASGSGPAFRANYGMDAPVYSVGSCMHTAKQDKPWWRVDLQKEYRISSVRIVARGDCCPNQYTKLSIHVGRNLGDQEGNDNALCGQVFSIPQHRVLTVPCPAGTVGRFINLVKNEDDSELSVCEVSVYGNELRSYKSAVMIDRPTAYWPLEERNEQGVYPNAVTSSIGDGVCEYEDNGTPVSACPNSVEVNGYQQFQANSHVPQFTDGTFVRVTSDSTMRLQTPFSLELWFKPFDLVAGMVAISKWDPHQEQRSWSLMLGGPNNNELHFVASLSGRSSPLFNTTLTLSVAPIEIDQWYHCVLVYQQPFLSFYLNGALVQTVQWKEGPPYAGSVSDLLIGAQHNLVDGMVRLETHPTGAVQIFKGGEWGTYCGRKETPGSSGSKVKTATMFCNQLGYADGGKATLDGSVGSGSTHHSHRPWCLMMLCAQARLLLVTGGALVDKQIFSSVNL